MSLDTAGTANATRPELRGPSRALILAVILSLPVAAQAGADLNAALALTATTERRAALESLLERGATPYERAVAGVRLAELLMLLAEPESAQKVLAATDRSQLDRNDRRSFDRIKQLLR